ncbi:MAG: acyl-CoA dehydratase activase [Candidatus Adiutricales bacterium]
MASAGIDVGSINTAVVTLDSERVLSTIIVNTDDFLLNPRQIVNQALEKAGFDLEKIDKIAATGRGRKSLDFVRKKSAEVVCQARGAIWINPSARTVLNLGAESSRILSVNEDGRVLSFAANDKCAAGSGLFFDSMAHLMDIPLADMGKLALEAESMEEVSSRCAVFAESEVISHIHRGVPKEAILAGLHKAVVDRILDLTSKVTILPEMVVTGGVAKNQAIIAELSAKLDLQLHLPPEPQLVGAVGAALLA